MKLKKILAAVSALCMLCAVVPFSGNVLPEQNMISASAATTITVDKNWTEGTYENLNYKKFTEYIEISGTTDKETTEIIIPAEIEGLPVTSIGLYAFSDCSGLTSVTVPDSITNISNNAFSGTPWLENQQKENPFVIINHILIDGSTCEGDITIPDTVTNIADSAFRECSALTSVIIPDSVTKIGGSVFAYCSGLTSVTIPDSVTSIGSSVFHKCSSLTSVTIPSSVTIIGLSPFMYCSSLTSIEVAENNTAYTSENGILFNKEKTILVAYPIGNTRTEYTIPSGVKIIEWDAFTSCQSLTSVIIPDSVTDIGNDAFEACRALTSVIIPSGVKSIGNFAFDDCTSLNSITVENPDCEIYDYEYTFSDTATIYGYEGSTAQAYAEKYNRNFESLGTAPETTETPDLKPGDADGDGKVDIMDVISINKALLGKEKLTDEQLKAIDFNGNGKPDAEDSLILMKYIAGLLETLPTP